MIRKTILFFFLIFCGGCGYYWQAGDEIPSLSIPFVKGDEYGDLTAEITTAISASGRALVLSRDADYRLEASIVGQSDDVIGFRRNPQRVDGKIRKNLVRTEGRRNLSIEITLFAEKTGKKVWGPFLITADSDYDYVDGDSAQDLTFVDRSGALVPVLPFSLGQLEGVEDAQIAVAKPLYQKIAQKVVDAIYWE